MSARMNTIKAIETRYKGCRFRSRTEARWAVFLDALDIPWEYEKEGYELPGGWYLPDFFFCPMGIWIHLEIKGFLPEYPSKETTLCEQLAEGTGLLVLLVGGTPDYDKELYEIFPDGWRTNTVGKFFVFATDANRVDGAIRSSRAARFEHGERP